MIKFYCERCGEYRKYIVSRYGENNYEILCKKCKLFLVSFIADEPGKYEIIKKEVFHE